MRNKKTTRRYTFFGRHRDRASSTMACTAYRIVPAMVLQLLVLNAYRAHGQNSARAGSYGMCDIYSSDKMASQVTSRFCPSRRSRHAVLIWRFHGPFPGHHHDHPDLTISGGVLRGVLSRALSRDPMVWAPLPFPPLPQEDRHGTSAFDTRLSIVNTVVGNGNAPLLPASHSALGTCWFSSLTLLAMVLGRPPAASPVGPCHTNPS